jgi:RHS repeat-associated protein
MPYSSPKSRRKSQFTPRVIIGSIILTMALPVSPAQAEVVGKQAGSTLGAGLAFLRNRLSASARLGGPQPQSVEDSSQRAARVTHVSLCPRRLLMYTGEEYTLSPLPLDTGGQAVHGVVFSWETANKEVADVASDGTVTALKPGQCVVTASVGNRKEVVLVEVRDGRRPFLTSAQWDQEHANDCVDPERSPLEIDNATGSAKSQGTVAPAVRDPDDPPGVASGGSAGNATGHPRFAANLASLSTVAGTDDNLRSNNFNLNIPIFNSTGRGVGIDLALVYNSRLWTKNGNTIYFDYDRGWPAPGFRLNYGRLVPNYNVTSGSGNYLLIETDGTRIPLIRQGTSQIYRSEDGQYIEFNASDSADLKLTYPDGTLIRYEFNGSKLLPTKVQDINTNSIVIDYVKNCADTPRMSGQECTCNTSGCDRAPRQAIKHISDTLGRFVRFYYYANGNLAKITVPKYANMGERDLVKFYYQTVSLSFNFGGFTVVDATQNEQVDMLRRVYFPDTGRGYVFGGYSGYGMFNKASRQLGMTDTTDGTEVAYTEYVFQTSGQLSDSPGYNQRKEWWKGKTNDSGAEVTTPAIYNYENVTGIGLITHKVTGPDQTRTEMVSKDSSGSTDDGSMQTHKVISSTGATLFQQEYIYTVSSTHGGVQRTTVDTLPDGMDSVRSRVEMTYGQYGRLLEQKEDGFRHNSTFRARRRTVYEYVDDSEYINLGLLRLSNGVKVFENNPVDTDPNNDTLIARTRYAYDDNSDPAWSIQKYGFTVGCTTPTCPAPPNFNTGKINRSQRANITKVELWSIASVTNPPDISFRHRYDIFGNEVKAELSCCSLRQITFEQDTAGMFYSEPKTVVEGPPGGPNLTTTYSFDFNTSFINSQTDPQGRTTSFAPDNAMRLSTVTLPKLSTDTNLNPKIETSFPPDPNYANKDGLLYQTKVTYKEAAAEGAAERVIVTNQWLDGSGRVLRTGTDAGTNPASFDVVKSIYDEFGRLRKTTNPYNTTNSDGDTTGFPDPLPNPTTYSYDAMGRVRTVTLPDTKTILTGYSGVEATVTDQVGRQHKSEVDGLGRVIQVSEQDPATGGLTWITSYAYDMLSNLTQVDQGGQIRKYKYDSLSRMTFEKIPEQDATINDGTGVLWSGKYTYTEFGAVSKRVDARGVETNYQYDGMSRLSGISYTGPGGGGLPSGVETTTPISINYNNLTGQQSSNGQVSFITDGAGREDYSYDGLSRVTSKQRTVDGNIYTTSYEYNQASQVAVMVYPSGKRVRMNHDPRGRMSGIDKVNTSNSVLLSYLSQVSYSEAGQVKTARLGTSSPIDESYTYDLQRLQLTNQTATRGSTSLLNLTYGYQATTGQSGTGTTSGNSGQLMSVSGTVNGQGRAQSFTYDNVGRLKSATGYQVWERRYDYDRFGNRTGVWDRVSGGSQIQSVVIQKPSNIESNRISTVNGVSYSYDAAGNLTSDNSSAQPNRFRYDAESRLVKVDGGATAIYSYDGANRRVKKQTSTGVTYYVWEGNQMIAEYSNSAQSGGGGLRYYLADKLSTRVVLDGAGNIIGTQDHQPFGEDGIMSAGELEKHRFTNYERDSETGTDYAINRQYQTSTGRFMRPDPVAGSISNPQSLNRYVYVGNDPVNWQDPSGLVRILIINCYTVSSLDHNGGGSSERQCFIEQVIELPDPGIFIGDPRTGGERPGNTDDGQSGEKRMKGSDKDLPTCDAFFPSLNPEDCFLIAELIKEYTDSIKERFDMLKPGSPTYGTHRDRINTERQILENCRQKYDNCKNNQKLPAGFDLNEAEEQLRRTFPGPSSLKEALIDRNGIIPLGIAACAIFPALCAALGGAATKRVPVPAVP